MQQIAFLPAVHLSVKFETPSKRDVPGITKSPQRRRIAGRYTTALACPAALQKYSFLLTPACRRGPRSHKYSQRNNEEDYQPLTKEFKRAAD